MSRRKRKTRKRRPARQQSIADRLINKWTLGGLGLIAVGLIGFLVATNQPATSSVAQSDVANQQDIPFPEVPRIPLQDAKTQFDAGSALIVDTRSQEEYASAHIPSAISLPLSDLSTQNPDLPRDQDIIMYCT